MSFSNNPSINPANNGSLTGAIQFAFQKMLQGTNNMLPAQVIRYDRESNRVQVQLMINLITTDGSQVPRPQLASIPVVSLGGGGYTINFPLKAGDLGWVFAADRDISLFLQSYAQSRPNTTRMRNFSDGVFIPDVMRGYTIQTGDEEALVIQDLDGKNRVSIGPNGVTIVSTVESVETKIEMSETGVKITAPVVEVDGNLTVTGTITGDGGLSLTGDMTMTGNMLVNGNIGATGTITPGV